MFFKELQLMNRVLLKRGFSLELAKKHDNIAKKDKKNAMPCFASLFNTHHAQHCMPFNRLLLLSTIFSYPQRTY